MLGALEFDFVLRLMLITTEENLIATQRGSWEVGMYRVQSEGV